MTAPLPPWRSQVPGIEWPPLLDGAAALVAAYVARLGETEWLDPAEIERQQRRQLAVLAEHCQRHSPAFAGRLKGAGLAPADLAQPGALERLPELTRQALQAGEGVHCAEVPEAHLPVGETGTSGSTGEPVRVRRTSLNQIGLLAMTVRDHVWHGRDAALPLASVSAHHARIEQQPDWGVPLGLLYRTGPLLNLPVSTDVAELHLRLLDFAPGVLVIYPSVLSALIDLIEQGGKGLPGLSQVRCMGETVSDDLRQRARAVLGLALEDGYSSQECGTMALQCPAGGGYHAMAETHILEVVDDQGRPCAPGAVGRVLVTDLHNFATPLVRYAIGDYAVAGAPCTCGRGLPRIERFLGRERNLVRKPDGTRHWPLVGFARFREIASVRQYQIVQHSLERVEARLVVDRALTGAEEAALAAVIRAALGHDFAVDFTHSDRPLKAGPGGKFEEFVCRIAAPPA